MLSAAVVKLTKGRLGDHTCVVVMSCKEILGCVLSDCQMSCVVRGAGKIRDAVGLSENALCDESGVGSGHWEAEGSRLVIEIEVAVAIGFAEWLFGSDSAANKSDATMTGSVTLEVMLEVGKVISNVLDKVIIDIEAAGMTATLNGVRVLERCGDGGCKVMVVVKSG